MDSTGSPGKLYNRFQSMSTTRKVALVLLLVSLVCGLYYLAPVFTRSTYAPLFTQLDPKEAGAIVEKLKAMKVNYQLTDQGQTILVPKNTVYETRIGLASSGALEGSSKGFELFDQNKIGVTDFEQQVFYQRALQEELRRTIVQLEGVQQARVHLVLPQKSVFLDDRGTPSASVALRLEPLARLKPEQVQGICNLVEGSIEGLKPENIHVIDMEGRVLSDELGKSADASLYQHASDRQQLKRNYEKDLEKRVQGVLETVLGPGKAVAMVTAEIDSTQEQVTTTVPFGDPAVVSEVTSSEKNTGSNAAGGLPGAGSNLDDNYPELTESGSAGSYSREESARNYQVGTRQETISRAPADIRRLSVAVILDSDPETAQVQTLSNTIAAAVGITPERGDQVLVSGMAFDSSLREQMNEEMNKADALADALAKEQKQRFYIYVGTAAVCLIVLLLIIYRILSSRSEDEEVLSVAEGKVVPLKLVEKSLASLEDEQYKDNPQQQELKEFARKKPEDVAQMLKVWMAED